MDNPLLERLSVEELYHKKSCYFYCFLLRFYGKILLNKEVPCYAEKHDR